MPRMMMSPKRSRRRSPKRSRRRSPKRSKRRSPKRSRRRSPKRRRRNMSPYGVEMNAYAGSQHVLYVWKKGDSKDMIKQLHPDIRNYGFLDEGIEMWFILYNNKTNFIYAECSASFEDGHYVIDDITPNRHNPELFDKIKTYLSGSKLKFLY